jgi:hypothetical protein
VHHATQGAHHFRRSPVIDSALDYPGHLTFGAILVTLKLWKTFYASPASAIVLAEHVGEGKIAIMALVRAITPDIDIAFEGEVGSGSGEEGGGPRRAFKDAKTSPIRRMTFRKGEVPLLSFRRGHFRAASQVCWTATRSIADALKLKKTAFRGSQL